GGRGMRKPPWGVGAGIVLSALVMVFAGAPGVIHAADHFDAPGSFKSPRLRNDADIADVYAFRSPERPDHSVLAFTTHPALGAVTTDPTYGTDVQYNLHVGDITYTLMFSSAFLGGLQAYAVYKTQAGRLSRIGQG